MSVAAVQLSINVRPKYPRRCVVCSGEHPDATVNVGDLMVGWFSFLTDIPEGCGEVKVPVHRKCRGAFRLRRWMGRLFYFAVVIGCFWLFWEPMQAALPVGIERIGMKVAALAAICPLVMIEHVFFPPRFDITVTKYYITFEFADARYAADFARLNNEPRRYEEIKRQMLSRPYR